MRTVRPLADLLDLLEDVDGPRAPLSLASRHSPQIHRKLLHHEAATGQAKESPAQERRQDAPCPAAPLRSRPVEAAAGDLLARIATTHPQARVTGIVLQPMVRHAHASEIFIGLADDATFGPVIAFGHGGTGVEVMGDVALALPPLDLNLAEALIRRTRVSRLLEGFRDRPRADMHAIALTLVKVSQIAIDIPEIREMDLNPLAADHRGALALDGRIAVAEPVVHPGRSGRSRLAVLPYPQEWERMLTLMSDVFEEK